MTHKEQMAELSRLSEELYQGHRRVKALQAEKASRREVSAAKDHVKQLDEVIDEAMEHLGLQRGSVISLGNGLRITRKENGEFKIRVHAAGDRGPLRETTRRVRAYPDTLGRKAKKSR